MKSQVKSLLNHLGLQISKKKSKADPPQKPAPDLSEQENAIITRCLPYTMTSTERLAALICSINHIARNKVPGAIVECGVWRGGSMMAAALSLLAHGDKSRELYLYDTFEGMPPPTARDERTDGTSAASLLAQDPKGTGIWCEAGLSDVRRNIKSLEYPESLIHFVRGKVEDTIPYQAPEKISLLRLDTDWYDSTNHELEHLFPRLQPNGILIIDDYGYWKGARAAVDEYFRKLPYPAFLHRIDETGRLFVKPV